MEAHCQADRARQGVRRVPAGRGRRGGCAGVHLRPGPPAAVARRHGTRRAGPVRQGPDGGLHHRTLPSQPSPDDQRAGRRRQARSNALVNSPYPMSLSVMNPHPTYVRRSVRGVCSILFAAAFAACGAPKGKDAASAPPSVLLSAADVVAATTADIGSTVVVSGALDPADVVRLRAQVAGTIRDLRVDRGTKVSRGQVLARVEAQGVTSQALATLAVAPSAEAGLAVARQRLDAGKRPVSYTHLRAHETRHD